MATIEYCVMENDLTCFRIEGEYYFSANDTAKYTGCYRGYLKSQFATSYHQYAGYFNPLLNAAQFSKDPETFKTLSELKFTEMPIEDLCKHTEAKGMIYVGLNMGGW